MVMMKKLRIYIDTSVIGGCLDEEFSKESHALIEMAYREEIILVMSDLLAAELLNAPDSVKAIYEKLPEKLTEFVQRSIETELLRDKYLGEGVLGMRCIDDAHHVAIATISKVDLIVSWNFKHLVHFDKIRGFNAVNLREGYLPIEIRSPLEVV